MAVFEAAQPDYAAKVRDNLAGQPFMVSIGVQIADIQPGSCEISVAQADVFVRVGDTEKQCAKALLTKLISQQ